MDFYQAIYTQSVAQFGSYVQAGTLLNNYAHIFDLLTRLRQATSYKSQATNHKLKVARYKLQVTSYKFLDLLTRLRQAVDHPY